MRVHPVRIEQAPLYLHITYSLCLHAAAISLLVALPVVGVSGAPPGGGYVVALTSQVEQPPPVGALEKTDGQAAGEPGGDEPADIAPGNKDAGTEGTDDDGKKDVAEDIQLPDVADDMRIQTRVNPVADKPDPVPIPSNITVPSAKAPELTATVKPLLAEMPSEPLQVNNSRAANKTDALHQAKTDPPALPKTAAAIKPTPPAAQPVQEKPLEKPDVPEVLPDPVPESVAVMPPVETTPPVPDRKIASSKNTAKTREKGDVSSSPDAIGTTPENRGKDPVVQSHPAGKTAGTASARKGGQAGSGDSDAGGQTSGSGTSSKKGGARGPAKSGGPPGAGRGEDIGTGNIAGTPLGSGKGYKFSAASPSPEVGLLRGLGDALGEPTLARGEGPSDKDMQEKKKKGTQDAPPVAIQVPEALLVRDIEIEVVADNKALSDISMDLTFRAHPANRKKHAKDAERKIEGAEIAIGKVDSGASSTKKILLRKAEKGVYIFSLTNTGSASSVAVVFHLYARSEQERMKEYKSFTLTPTTVTTFKFLMPEALFWDDTDRFSGNIEDSHSVTRFRHETGLLWKEEKE